MIATRQTIHHMLRSPQSSPDNLTWVKIQGEKHLQYEIFNIM